jgi:hypothetical protein
MGLFFKTSKTALDFQKWPMWLASGVDGAWSLQGSPVGDPDQSDHLAGA